MLKTVLPFLLLFSVISSKSHAEIKDYQVIRLVSMKSDCSRDTLTVHDSNDSSVSFHVQCFNLSHYPDGVRVYCGDREDERSCEIMTASREYKHLKLLQTDNK